MAYRLRDLSRATRNAPKDSVLRGEGKRIDNEGAFGLIGLALFFDLLQMTQLIPFIGFFFAPLSIPITITAYVFIFVALKTFFKDIPILGGAQVMMRMGAVFGSMVFEFVPLLSAIPAITPGVVALIVSVRLEDMGKGRFLPRVGNIFSRRKRELFESQQKNILESARNTIDSEITSAQSNPRRKGLRQDRNQRKGSAQNPDNEFRQGAREFDMKERYADEDEGQEVRKVPFERGDRVRLTAARVRALRREGLMSRFPSTSGTVVNAYPGGYSVQFGFSKQEVSADDIERA